MSIKDLNNMTKKTEEFIKGADLKKIATVAKGKGGRPKKSDAEKLNQQIFVNCTADEKESLELAAQKMRMSVSNFVKFKLDEANVFKTK